jgi:hypothetical protein
MEAFILVPGIPGSRMELAGVEIWPPTATEWLSGYKRIADLKDPQTFPTKIVDVIDLFGLPYPVYRPIMEDLDYIATHNTAGPSNLRVDFFYDWRKDIVKVGVPALVDAIKQAGKATSINLICHSAGGILARLVLENRANHPQPWFRKIKRFISICSPHFGVPEVLAYALGRIKGFPPISIEDTLDLVGDPRYPAAYQFFPDPGDITLYDNSSSPPEQDIYNLAVQDKYGLTKSSVDALKEARSGLDYRKNRPAGVRYFLFAGNGHETDDKYFFNKTNYRPPPFPTDGDGFVPCWSADPGFGISFRFPASHSDMISNPAFRDKLYKILGATTMPFPYISDKLGIFVSINKQVFKPGEMMNVLLVPDAPAAEIDGHLRLDSAVYERGTAKGILLPYGAGTSIKYKGAEAKYLRTQLSAPTKPGIYKMHFDGTHSTSKETAPVFIVHEELHIGISGEPTKETSQVPRSRRKKRKPAKKKK